MMTNEKPPEKYIPSPNDVRVGRNIYRVSVRHRYSNKDREEPVTRTDLIDALTRSLDYYHEVSGGVPKKDMEAIVRKGMELIAADPSSSPQEYPITCSICGAPDVVPFKPHPGVPIGCRRCRNDIHVPVGYWRQFMQSITLKGTVRDDMDDYILYYSILDHIDD